RRSSPESRSRRPAGEPCSSRPPARRDRSPRSAASRTPQPARRPPPAPCTRHVGPSCRQSDRCNPSLFPFSDESARRLEELIQGLAELFQGPPVRDLQVAVLVDADVEPGRSQGGVCLLSNTIPLGLSDRVGHVGAPQDGDVHHPATPLLPVIEMEAGASRSEE